MEKYYGVSLLIFFILKVSQVSPLTGTNQLECSAVNEDGYLYFPDYPVGRGHLSGATRLTLVQALHIYSFTPNCMGNITGADFCFHYHNTSTIRAQVVFWLYEFKRIDDRGNIVPKNNLTRSLWALPIDRTRCISAEPLLGLFCCARMTFLGNNPIPLTTGEEIVLAILANNDVDIYTLLQYSTTEYDVRTFDVDLTTLPPGSVFDHIYGPSNTEEDIAPFPIMRFVVESAENFTMKDLPVPTPAPQNSLLIPFSTVIVILGVASVISIIGLVITILLCLKQKKQAAKKETATPYIEYSNRLEGTLKTDTGAGNTADLQPSANELIHQAHPLNSVQYEKNNSYGPRGARSPFATQREIESSTLANEFNRTYRYKYAS